MCVCHRGAGRQRRAFESQIETDDAAARAATAKPAAAAAPPWVVRACSSMVLDSGGVYAAALSSGEWLGGGLDAVRGGGS